MSDAWAAEHARQEQQDMTDYLIGLLMAAETNLSQASELIAHSPSIQRLFSGKTIDAKWDERFRHYIRQRVTNIATDTLSIREMLQGAPSEEMRG